MRSKTFPSDTKSDWLWMTIMHQSTSGESQKYFWNSLCFKSHTLWCASWSEIYVHYDPLRSWSRYTISRFFQKVVTLVMWPWREAAFCNFFQEMSRKLLSITWLLEAIDLWKLPVHPMAFSLEISAECSSEIIISLVLCHFTESKRLMKSIHPMKERQHCVSISLSVHWVH